MQILVVGAGVVGLAVARAAALAGHEVIVAEQAAGIGHGISSRNSEVIHAGIYYPSGSLRAYHCPRGRRMLYDYCASHGVPHRKCGKLVVATNDVEAAKLEALLAQALANGCENMGLIAARRSATHGAGARLHRRAELAGDRNHRQPCLHARAAGRSGGSRRDGCVQHAHRRSRILAGRLAGALRQS